MRLIRRKREKQSKQMTKGETYSSAKYHKSEQSQTILLEQF